MTGPKRLAESIKEEVRQFLKEQLRLELSQEKTRITHAKTEEAHFLGVRLSIGNAHRAEAKIGSQRSPDGRMFKRRVTGWIPILKAPTPDLVQRLHQRGFCDAEGFPTSQKKWLLLDADQIIRLYNSILRGLLKYYRFVDNFASLSRIQYILRYSLAKTLAHKYRRSMFEIFRRHGRNLRFEWTSRDGDRKMVCFAENADWTRKSDAFVTGPTGPRPSGVASVSAEPIEAWATHASSAARRRTWKCTTSATSARWGPGSRRALRPVMRLQNRKQIPVCQDMSSEDPQRRI